MLMPFPDCTDRWLLEDAPANAVVVSSRARLARNLPGIPFSPRANSEKLVMIAETVGDAFAQSGLLSAYDRFLMTELSSAQRQFLKESHLISSEFEKGGVGRTVYFSPAMNVSLMVNEEDHLRMSSMLSGFRLTSAYRQLLSVENETGRLLRIAFSPELGFLTACPTNTGTALRLSTLLHLPALAIVGQVENALSQLGNYGLVVRGAYGENTDNTGDLYQVSNEITLGKTEEELLELLAQCVEQLVEAELNARETLMRETSDKIEDAIYRAVGVLSMARRLDSTETASLLSRTRLGIGTMSEIPWTHAQLNWLLVQIQPSHIQTKQPQDVEASERDLTRAEMIRGMIEGKIEPPGFNN